MTYQKWAFTVVVLITLLNVAFQNLLLAFVLLTCIAITYKVVRKYDLINQSLLRLITMRPPTSSYYTPRRHSSPPQESVITPPQGEDATIARISPISQKYGEVENDEGMLMVIPL